MVRICFVIITLVFLSLPLRAQDIVELIRFDSATLTEVDGERVQKLINARMSMRDVTMICDSAFRYLDRDEMRASETSKLILKLKIYGLIPYIITQMMKSVYYEVE